MNEGFFQITVKTLEGLEEILADEIRQIGGREISPGKRAVHFTGDNAMLYRANFRLRTALRVLRGIQTFGFRDVDDFFLKCLRIRWEQYMGPDDTFAVNSTVIQSELFRNSMFASLKVKDAIADHFRQKSGRRPNVDTSNPDLLFHVHISGTTCTLSVDSSGESLHKRGYRVATGEAPLNEVLAAGMILLTGWKGNSDFLDPMCGSGTLPIEAALIARNIPPGKFRKTFAFMKWKEYDPELFRNIREETIPVEFNHTIFAADLNPGNLGLARTNARNARIFNNIDFIAADFRDLNLEIHDAVIIINPPYGERMQGDDLPSLYQTIGERLKHHYPGNRAWILSSSPELLTKIGLKPRKKITLFNGGIESAFQHFDLFEGKRKTAFLKKNGTTKPGPSLDTPGSKKKLRKTNLP